MRCDQFREAASAAMDGEPVGTTTTVLDRHRRTCPACVAWESDAETLTRRLRMRPAETVPDDFTARVMASVVLPGRRVRRRQNVLRAALLATAIVQLVVAAPALFGDSMGMAMSMHASHESAAWNAAIGLALAGVAWRPARVGGALSVLAPFVVVLAVLSTVDVVAGHVGIERLTTHLGCLVGVALLGGLVWTRRGLLPDSPLSLATGDTPAAVDEVHGRRGAA